MPQSAPVKRGAQRHASQPIPESRHEFARDVVAKAAIVDPEIEGRLIEAFSQVPRELFIDPRYIHRRHQDISMGCQLSGVSNYLKPSQLARMLALLDIKPKVRVLELGAHSGYGCAVIAKLGAIAYGIDDKPSLAQLARRNLDRMKLFNAMIKSGTLSKGWPDYAPYDRILISSANLTDIPATLTQQLVTPGGRIVAILPCNSSSPPQHHVTIIETNSTGLTKVTLEATS